MGLLSFFVRIQTSRTRHTSRSQTGSKPTAALFSASFGDTSGQWTASRNAFMRQSIFSVKREVHRELRAKYHRTVPGFDLYLCGHGFTAWANTPGASAVRFLPPRGGFHQGTTTNFELEYNLPVRSFEGGGAVGYLTRVEYGLAAFRDTVSQLNEAGHYGVVTSHEEMSVLRAKYVVQTPTKWDLYAILNLAIARP